MNSEWNEVLTDRETDGIISCTAITGFPRLVVVAFAVPHLTLT
jgi:hypothetical protein